MLVLSKFLIRHLETINGLRVWLIEVNHLDQTAQVGNYKQAFTNVQDFEHGDVLVDMSDRSQVLDLCIEDGRHAKLEDVLPLPGDEGLSLL